MAFQIAEDQKRELVKLCRAHRVRSLWLTGSALTNEFDPDRSDLDFLVDFEQLAPAEHKDSYFGLLEGLRLLFGKPVDLMEISAVTNPYVRASLEQRMDPLYAAA